MNKEDLILDTQQGLSSYQIAKKYNKSQTSIRYWLKKYKLQSNLLISKSTKHKLKYDPVEIQKLIDRGESYRSIRDLLGVSFQTLKNYSCKGLIKFRTKSEISKEQCKNKTHIFTNGSKLNYREGSRGGYRSKAGCGKGLYVNDSFGNKVYLQSSYEVKCSDILNSLSIRWARPSYLLYKSDKIRKYFPDFYLPDHNLYLDPKNNFLIKKDIEKIKLVIEQNNINLIVLSDNKLTTNFIKDILQIP